MLYWFLLLWTACVDFMHETQGLRFMWAQETKERRPYALHNHLLFASFTATFENSSIPWISSSSSCFFLVHTGSIVKGPGFGLYLIFSSKQSKETHRTCRVRLLIDCLQIESKPIGVLADYTIFTYLCRNAGSFAFSWHHLCLDLAYLHICTGNLSTLLQYHILHIYLYMYIYIILVQYPNDASKSLFKKKKPVSELAELSSFRLVLPCLF